jgi:hypothetical protein
MKDVEICFESGVPETCFTSQPTHLAGEYRVLHGRKAALKEWREQP